MSTDARLERYLDGYRNPTKWQDAEVAGDPQLAALRIALDSSLERLGKSAAIVDLGMGSGLLAKQLSTLDRFRNGEQRYIGVDISLSGEAVGVSGLETGLIASQRASYYTIATFLSANPLSGGDALVVLRNVLHEVDLCTMSELLAIVLSAEGERIEVVIQDMESLAEAEIGSAPWELDSIVYVLEEIGFEATSRITDESRSGTPWYTLALRRAARGEVSRAAILRALISTRSKQADGVQGRAMALLHSGGAGSAESRLAILKGQNDGFALGAQLARARREERKLRSIQLCGTEDGLSEVSWTEIADAIGRFLDGAQFRPDLIVGIARGGLPVAVAFSHRLAGVQLGAVMKRYYRADDKPFFVFDPGTQARSHRDKLMDGVVIPHATNGYKSVLIVDDVTTFGNTLASAEEQIRHILGSGPEIRFFTFACDRARLSVSRPSISKRLSTGREIDNHKTWLTFPWENLGPEP